MAPPPPRRPRQPKVRKTIRRRGPRCSIVRSTVTMDPWRPRHPQRPRQPTVKRTINRRGLAAATLRPHTSQGCNPWNAGRNEDAVCRTAAYSAAWHTSMGTVICSGPSDRTSSYVSAFQGLHPWLVCRRPVGAITTNKIHTYSQETPATPAQPPKSPKTPLPPILPPLLGQYLTKP